MAIRTMFLVYSKRLGAVWFFKEIKDSSPKNKNLSLITHHHKLTQGHIKLIKTYTVPLNFLVIKQAEKIPQFHHENSA